MIRNTTDMCGIPYIICQSLGDLGVVRSSHHRAPKEGT